MSYKPVVIKPMFIEEEDPIEIVEEYLGIEDQRLQRIKDKYGCMKICKETGYQLKNEMKKIEHLRKAKENDRLYEKCYVLLNSMLRHLESRMRD